MAGKLILIRHGESEANRERCFSASDDVPLTPLGLSQAHSIAIRIATLFRPTRLLTSEFLRARQTAEVIGARLVLPCEQIPGMHERDFGSVKGLPYRSLTELIAADASYNPAQEWLWAPPGGESPDDVRRRVMPAIEKVRDRFPNEEVLIVCHGVVMVAVWAHLAGNWQAAKVPSNCGVLVIEHDSGVFRHPVLVDGAQTVPGQSEAG